MVIANILGLFISLYVLVKSSDYAIRYSAKLARFFQVSSFLVSFIIVSIISVLPEAAVAIMSSLKGSPNLGLGTLLGSNVTDLSLIFGLIALFSGTGIKVKSNIVRREFLYLLFLAFPLLLGVDGNFSRIDGAILIIAGIFFFITLYKDSKMFSKKYNHTNKVSSSNSLFFLTISMLVLIAAAFFTVKFSVGLANDLNLPSILIGLIAVSIGTCLPEFFFSMRAVRKKEDGLALGDILGTVMVDATVILGLIALISPFNFNSRTMIITSSFMMLAGVISMWFVQTDMELSEKEGLFLILFYFIFITAEILISLGHL